MIAEAEVFLLADRVALDVFTAIRDEQWELILPPVFDMPGADESVPLRQAINHYAYDNAWVPDMLAGRTMDVVGRDRFDGDLLGDHPAGALGRIHHWAVAAASGVDDPQLTVHCSYGDCGVADYFWQLNIARTLSAHDVAARIGVDDLLTDELSRAMFNATEPSAALWRSFGVYRAAVPVQPNASWRERFLALTGRRD